MEFKDLCTVIKDCKKQGTKLQIKNLSTMETHPVINYEIVDPTFKSGVILSFEIEPSFSHMICEKEANAINKIDENIYEIKTPYGHYDIIIN